MNSLDNPKKLIEELFTAQTEASKLILILLLIMKRETELDVLKSLFAEYIVKRSNNLKKSMFEKSIKSMDGDLLKIYKDEELEDDEELYSITPILVKFKDPSIEEFVYSYFIDNQEEYIQNLITCTNLLNIIFEICFKFEIKLTEKNKTEISNHIINNYNELYYLYLKDLILEEEGNACKIDILTKCIKIYEIIKNEKLGDFLKEKAKEIIYFLVNERDKLYDDDLHYSIALIEEIKKGSLGIKINANDVILGYLNNVKCGKDLVFFSDLKEVFPKEYEILINENIDEVQEFVEDILLNDAIKYYEEDNTNKIYDLIEYIYTTIWDEFLFEPDKFFEEELYECANISTEKIETYEYNDKKYERKKEEEKRKREIIEKEKRKLYGINNEYLEKDKAIEYIKKVVKNKEKENYLIDKVNNKYLEKFWYITGFISDKKEIDFLCKVFYKIKIEDKPNRIWDKIEKYIIKCIRDELEISDKEIIECVGKIAFFEMRRGQNVFSEKNLRENKTLNIDKQILNKLIEKEIIIKDGRWLYFVSTDIQIYFAIKYLIQNNLSWNELKIENAYMGYFEDEIDKITKMYKMENEKMYNKYSKDIIQEYLKNVDTKNIVTICRTFIKPLDINVEIDKYGRNDSGAMKVVEIEEILRCEEIDILYANGVFEKIYEDSKIKSKFRMLYGEGNIELSINEALEDYEKNMFLYEIGYWDYIMEVYKFLLDFIQK